MAKSLSIGAVGGLAGLLLAGLALAGAACSSSSDASLERARDTNSASESGPGQAAVRGDGVSAPAEEGALDAAEVPRTTVCNGSCEERCDCLEQACSSTQPSWSCRRATTACRDGCGKSTCTSADPSCAGLPPAPNGARDPEDPAPPPGGPGPDPNPVDAPAGNASAR